MTDERSREEARKQWERDTTATRARLDQELRKPAPARNRWVRDIRQRVHSIHDREDEPGRTYRILVDIHTLIRKRAEEDLIPHVKNSPHHLFFDQTMDFGEDIREERWGERPPSLPGPARTRDRERGPDDQDVTQTQWIARMEEAVHWLENTVEREEAHREAERAGMNMPPYIPDQLVQNYYGSSLPVAALAWAWGETLIRDRGAALPQEKNRSL